MTTVTFGVVVAVAALVRVAAASPSASSATVAAGSSASFSPSSEDIANPDRGLYHYAETHFRPDGTGAAPLDTAVLKGWRSSEKITLVYRIFYLERYVDRDDIDAAALQFIATDFATARAAGVKLVVRFAYSDVSSRDAPAPRVVAHLRLLAPILNASADTIAVLQAGFVGRWGEWYYTDNFASDPGRPWLLSSADWAARQTVLDTLLGVTSPGILVQVRYPAIKQKLLPPTDPRAARVGVHDDCFLASTDDYGTFATDADRTWLADQTRKVPMGGETCEYNAPRSLWAGASGELAAYHWTYLNADYQRSVLDSWGYQGLDEARRRLGYRLRLVDASTSSTAQVGQTVTITLAVANDGYAAPLRNRPVQLVFSGSAGAYTVPLVADVRKFAPGQTTYLSASVAVPATSGTYSLYLALPDPSARLSKQPAYAIQLANSNTWVASSGQNDLHLGIRVDPVPACAG